MPNLIQFLEDSVVGQIAAGEVIEGPSAVMKELIENSLDAGALSISIAVEDGGKSLIRVSDDGLGMSEADLKLAFLRHSTSKIRKAEDLWSVATLGFRGEALASIASVARVEAVTCEQKSVDGFKIIIEGGLVKDLSPAAGVEGTSVSVRDLFFNTPARKKFLKSDSREADKCFTVFRYMALSRSNVEWKYFHKNKIVLHLPPADLPHRIGDIFGEAFKEGLIEVDSIEGGYRLFGFASDKSHLRRTREHQYIFLNGRKIIDRRIGSIVNNVYQLQAGEFPLYILFLEMDPAEVDVNVHPTKSEVRFRQEKSVYDFLYKAFNKALGLESNFVSFTPENRNYYSPRSKLGEQMPITVKDFGLLFVQPYPAHSSAENTIPLSPVTTPSETGHYIPKALFQLEGKYIVTQIKSGIALFDQHASHERILFESALSVLNKEEAPSQQLLFPRLFDISPAEEGSFEELSTYLVRMGFAIKPFGMRTYLIEAVPAGVKISDELGLLREMLEFFKETTRWEDPAERAAAAFACKAAIKAGTSLSSEEMVALIEALFRTGTPFQCPHGRPTYIKIEIGELDRRFGRI
jgi:DNA mismatch repair protein MutL